MHHHLSRSLYIPVGFLRLIYIRLSHCFTYIILLDAPLKHASTEGYHTPSGDPMPRNKIILTCPIYAANNNQRPLRNATDARIISLAKLLARHSVHHHMTSLPLVANDNPPDESP